MTITDCYQYIQDRINALSTNYGDNVPKHIFVRTFNAAQTTWVEERCKISSSNIIRTDEIDPLSTTYEFEPVKKEGYWEGSLPDNYYHFRRAIGFTPCQLFLYLKKEEEINRLLSDDNWKPSLEWAESIVTVSGKKLKVYGDFNIDKVELLYYRVPNLVNMEDGYSDEFGNPNVNINPEFQESSLIEILTMTVNQLAADNGDSFRYQTSGQKATT
jgi:hypothetical protein